MKLTPLNLRPSSVNDTNQHCRENGAADSPRSGPEHGRCCQPQVTGPKLSVQGLGPGVKWTKTYWGRLQRGGFGGETRDGRLEEVPFEFNFKA